MNTDAKKWDDLTRTEQQIQNTQALIKYHKEAMRALDATGCAYSSLLVLKREVDTLELRLELLKNEVRHA